MTVDIIGRLTEILTDVRSNIGTLPGTIYYVNTTTGNDNYDGLSRENPLATIGAAITAAAAGDAIHIARGAYDEAISIPAGLVGINVICEPGVYLSNTTPGTVVAIAAPHAQWEGGVIVQAGQTGLQVTGEWFKGKHIRISGCAIGYDMDAAHPVLVDCKAYACTTTGFDISEDSGIYIDCFCPGAAASRGFYLSHTNAENNIIVRGITLNCTAGAYECVAGADNNIFQDCGQSSLCAGPTDAGANNSFVNHKEESQVTGGQSLQDDLSDIYNAIYLEQTVPIMMNSEQTLTNAAGNKDFVATNTRGGQGLISTTDADMQRAFLLIIGRANNTYAGVNDLDCSTATHNQWRMNLDGGAYSDLVNGAFADGQMLDTDWLCEAEGVIHPFTLMFDITSQLTNVDGLIGVRLENGRSSQTSLIVTCDIYLKILWKF